MTIDLPLNRSSAAALSVRIARRSFTARRAIDCGTWRLPPESVRRFFDTRGNSSPETSSTIRMETRSTLITSKVISTTFSSSLSTSCCFESSFEMSRRRLSFLACRSSTDAPVSFNCAAALGRSPTDSLGRDPRQEQAGQVSVGQLRCASGSHDERVRVVAPNVFVPAAGVRARQATQRKHVRYEAELGVRFARADELRHLVEACEVMQRLGSDGEFDRLGNVAERNEAVSFTRHH